MNPLLGLSALYALNKSQGSGANDSTLGAYALTSWGWLVIRLPWDMWTIIGNDVGFNTNNKGVFQLRFGTPAAGTAAQVQFKSYLANQVMTAREAAFAWWWANPRLISVKWRGFVWALDEHNSIATVTSGHFLGKVLQGTQTSCSDVISTILRQPGADLEPLRSTTVGHGPHCRTAWR